MSHKCEGCGQIISDDNIFCMNCGTRQKQSETSFAEIHKMDAEQATLLVNLIDASRQDNSKYNKSKRKNRKNRRAHLFEQRQISSDDVMTPAEAKPMPAHSFSTESLSNNESLQSEDSAALEEPNKALYENKNETGETEIVHATSDKEIDTAIGGNTELKKETSEYIDSNDFVSSVEGQNLDVKELASIAEEPPMCANELKESEKKAFVEDVPMAAPSVSINDISFVNQYVNAEDILNAVYPTFSNNVHGFKGFFLGNSGTKREDFIEKYVQYLYNAGKLDEPSPYIVSFGMCPKEIKEGVFYVISDLQAAITHLFNLEDFSDAASQQQKYYEDIMQRIITAPAAAYIVFVGTEDEYRSFISLNAKTSYLFDKKVVFPDLSNDEIVDIYEKMLPSTHKNQFTADFKSAALTFLKNNRRYFPFSNEELASYMLQYGIRQDELKLPPDKYDPKTLEKAFAQIIGMKNVKSQISELAKYLQIRSKLIAAGAKLPDFNLHMMFLGNPGVGKTMIARTVSKLLFDLGYIRENKVVEVTSKDLIGAYANQTGIKTNKVIMNALGGVLFIDEAYSLAISCGQAGAEAIAIIIKAMMDHKDDLVVMFAGYTLEMKQFKDSNSGIASRISYVFNFNDYSEEELYDIFELKIHNIGMTINEEAIEKVKHLCKQFAGRKNVGNGRFVDNLIQKALTKHATLDLKESELLELTAGSIPSVQEIMTTVD
jgi:hypothetical protein